MRKMCSNFKSSTIQLIPKVLRVRPPQKSLFRHASSALRQFDYSLLAIKLAPAHPLDLYGEVSLLFARSSTHCPPHVPHGGSMAPAALARDIDSLKKELDASLHELLQSSSSGRQS